MKTPLLSIIIPTYNEESLLPGLLKSINAQVGISFEVIVADNHSKDKTRKIALAHGARVVEGGLPGRGRNHGAAVAKGEILLFLDADVFLPANDFLKKTVAEFNRNKLDIATCIACPMSENAIDKLCYGIYNFYIKMVGPLLRHAPGFCIFVRKNIHEAIGGFDEKIKLAEDHDYAERTKKIAKFGVLKSYPIVVSVRRFERDGRLNVVTRYVLCEAYMILKGPIKSDIFKYRFGYKNKKVKK